MIVQKTLWMPWIVRINQRLMKQNQIAHGNTNNGAQTWVLETQNREGKSHRTRTIMWCLEILKMISEREPQKRGWWDTGTENKSDLTGTQGNGYCQDLQMISNKWEGVGDNWKLNNKLERDFDIITKSSIKPWIEYTTIAEKIASMIQYSKKGMETETTNNIILLHKSLM